MKLLVLFGVLAAIGFAVFSYGVGEHDAPRLLKLLLLLAFVGGAFLLSRRALGPMVRDAAIWGLIFVGVTAAYVFRYDAQDLASRFTGGLLPGSPVTAYNEEGRAEVTLTRLPNGHFESDARVNGQPVRFLIDTGATGIALSYRTARRIGLPVDELPFSGSTRTANGIARVASVRLDRIEVGGIARENLRATVSSPGALNVNLLGQSFLESLSSYTRRADRLTLRD